MDMLPQFLKPVTAAAVADDLGGAPSAPQKMGSVAGFSMTTQEETQWCWAAVTQSVEDWGGNLASQSEIASYHIDPAASGLICAHPLGPGSSGSLCQDCQAGCAAPHSLRSVLDQRGRLTSGGAHNKVPSFLDIETAITNMTPLPVRIEWGGGKGHFVCISGYAVDANGDEWVTVFDPLLPAVNSGPADDQDMRYTTFATAYPSSSGSTGTPNYLYEVQ